MTKPLMPETRRLRPHDWLVILAFVVSYFGARQVLEHVEPGSPAALVLALAPAPFFAWAMWGYTRMLREMDELSRRIQLEALAIAFPASLLILFTVGLLHRAGFEGEGDFDPPKLWTWLLLPYFFGLWRANSRYS